LLPDLSYASPRETWSPPFSSLVHGRMRAWQNSRGKQKSGAYLRSSAPCSMPRVLLISSEGKATRPHLFRRSKNMTKTVLENRPLPVLPQQETCLQPRFCPTRILFQAFLPHPSQPMILVKVSWSTFLISRSPIQNSLSKSYVLFPLHW